MRLFRRLHARSFLLALSVALLLAQVCHNICFATACHEQKQAGQQVQHQQAGHCHQPQAEPQSGSAPAQPEPEPSHCQNHNLTVLPEFNGAASALVTPDDFVVALLPCRATFFPEPQFVSGVMVCPTESPPRLPQRFILRI